MKCFKNARVYVEGRGVITADVSFGDIITDIGGAVGDRIDIPEGATVLPGFIDEHIHGAGGADTMDCSQNALSAMARAVAAEGVTRFLATTMSSSRKRTLSAVGEVEKYRSSLNRDGAEILGVHLEGPFISRKYAGAQCAKFICKPDISYMDRLVSASGGCIRMVTLAPETEGSDKLIKYLNGRKITVSVGHTAATYGQLSDAVRRGARCVTHTFNAQSPFHHRDIGTAGGALLEDGLAAELIADTVHVSVPAIKLLFKNKRRDKIILVTDSMRAKGLADGEYELGGSQVTVKDGRAETQNGRLAGSVLKMNVAIKNLVEKAGIPLERAVDCATLNPAKNLGICKKYGSIREGKAADFAVIDKAFNVLYTIRAGEIIYRS